MVDGIVAAQVDARGGNSLLIRTLEYNVIVRCLALTDLRMVRGRAY